MKYSDDKKISTKGRVLVVDDQPANVKLLGVKLSSAGYEVLKAYSGEEAVEISRKLQPDIILLDIIMPGMDGFEVTERLKQDPETSTIPIVLLTSLAGVDDNVRGLDAGADDFLSKPVNQTELFTRVRSLMRLKELQDQLRAREKSFVHSAQELSEPGRMKQNIILVVEDDEKTAKQMRKVLESDGYDTVVAKDSQSALAIINTSTPDLILIDIILPEVSGLELVQRLKTDPSLEDVPIIMNSVLADLETRVKGIDLGADDYLVKPVNSLEMLARVRANLRKKAVRQQLRRDLDALFKQSITDSLTGLYTRQYLITIAEREITSSKRYNRPFSALMLDIDHFKRLNDTFGHLSGDSVLKELGNILTNNIRTCDVAARYGGEEFIVILSDTNLQGALVTAERLRVAVETYPFPEVGGEKITMSVGVTELRANDINVNSLIKRADEALYMVKKDGRNSVKEG